MSNHLERRLRNYSAAIGSLAVAAPALGAVEDIQLQTVEGTESSTDFFTYSGSLDLDGDGTEDFSVFGFYSTAGDYGYIDLSGDSTSDPDLPYNLGHAEYNASAYSYVAIPLEAGETVDESTGAYTSFFRVFGHQPDYEEFFEQRGFVGVNFDIPGNSPHFGCMEILVEDDNGDGAPDLQVVGGVYDDDPETAVDCASRGFVPPEPRTVPVNGLTFWLTALLAGGAMLYSGQRRRRRQKT